MPDARAEPTVADEAIWPCDRAACDSPASFVCRSVDDIFRACDEHADGYERMTVDEYRAWRTW